MSKKILVFAIMGILVLGAGGFFLARRGTKVSQVSTATVSQSDLTAVTTASGKIKSVNQTDIFAKASGPVQRLPIEEGQWVSKGQLILQLDIAAIQADLAQKEAALKTAFQKKKGLEESLYTETDLKAAEALVNEKQEAWEEAERDYNDDKTDTKRLAKNTAYTAYLQAQEKLENLKKSNPTGEDWLAVNAEIEAAKKGISAAKTALSHLSLFAPHAGTLIYFESELVDKISPSSVVTAGQKLFTIADLKNMEFEAEVDETDAGEIKLDQIANVTLDAYPNQTLAGEVSWIDSQTHTTSTGGTAFTVKIELEPTDLELKIGMNGDAEIIIAEKKEVLALPANALIEKEENKFVFIVEDSTVSLKQIETGLENETSFEIVAGLTGGERVIVGNLEKLKDGQKVYVAPN